VQVITGSLVLSVSDKDALVVETSSEKQVVKAALSSAIASSLQGVEEDMVQILSVTAARRLEALGDWVWGAALADRRLTAGSVTVKYEIRIPPTASIPAPVTASTISNAFVGTGFTSGITSAMQAAGISIDVTGASVSAPTVSYAVDSVLTLGKQATTTAEEEATAEGEATTTAGPAGGGQGRLGRTPSRSTRHSRAFELLAVLVLIALSC